MKYLKFCLLSLLLLFSCKNKQETGTNEDVLDVRLKSDPVALNPLFNNRATARLVHQYIYLPLADYHPKTYELTPILIEEIPQENYNAQGEVSYTMRIRSEAKWDDGSPITAEDYLFTMKCILFSRLPANSLRGYFNDVKNVSIDPVDPKVFTITFSEYYMLSLASAISITIFPKHIYDPSNIMGNYKIAQVKEEEYMDKKLQDNPALSAWVDKMNSPLYLTEEIVNCGPYQLISWDKDRSLVLEKKPDYWAKNIDLPFFRQGPAKINFYVIPDEVTVISQLKASQLDVANGISTSAFIDLKNNQEYQDEFNFYTPTLSRYYYLSINNNHPILKDKDVRLAMAHLVDVDKIISNIEKGMGIRLASLVHPLRSYYHKNLKPIPYDLEKAKTILLNDGWEDIDNDGDLDKRISGEWTDLSLDIYVSEQPLGRYVALMLQENARKIGVNINIITKSFRSYFTENIRNRDYGLAALVSSRAIASDDDFYQNWHSDNDAPGKNNYYSYHNPEVDNILIEIQNTADREQRIKLYKDLQELIYEDAPVIFLYAPTEKIIVSKKWQSYATAKRPGYLANTFTPKTK